MFIRFTASAFRKLLSIVVFSSFPFGFEGSIWDLIVSVPDHCLSFYFNTKAIFIKPQGLIKHRFQLIFRLSGILNLNLFENEFLKIFTTFN